MLKGINQGCFPDRISMDRLFAVSSDAGYDAVELNLGLAGGVGLTMETTVSEAEAIASMARKYSIKLCSISTGLLWTYPLSSPDDSVRKQGRKVVIKQLEIAELLDIDTILVVPGIVNDLTSYDECYDRSRCELEALTQEAEKRGVRIGVENVWNKFLLSPLEMCSYVDEFNSPYIGVYFDVGNVLPFGYPEQWIRILGNRILKVHVKDYRSGVGTGQGFVPLLAGDVDWISVRAALKVIDYRGVITAEVGRYKVNPFQTAYDTARHMDIIIGMNK